MSLPAKSDERTFDPLLERATPELYRHNAWRVLGLPIPAKAAEPIAQPAILPLDESPSETELASARSKLSDPLSRLFEEFFWFWPEEAEGSDEAFAYLQEHRLDDARRILAGRLGAGRGVVPAHNLALLNHFAALELEHRAQIAVLSQKALEERQHLWGRSLSGWKELFADPLLTARLQGLAPADRAWSIVSLRDFLERAVLLVSARLATMADRLGDRDEAQRHLQLLRASGLRLELVAGHFREHLAPVAEKIREACRATEKSGTAHPAEGAQGLIAFAEPHFQTLEAWLGSDDPSCASLRDEVAALAVELAIAQGERTGNWDESKRLFARIRLTLSPSDSICRRMAESVRSVDSLRQNSVCHFCQDAAGDDFTALYVHVHGDVVTTPIVGMTVERTWRQAVVKVPRCAKCKAFHDSPPNEEEEMVKRMLIAGVAGFALFAVGYLWLWLAGYRAGPLFQGALLLAVSALALFGVATGVGYLLKMWASHIALPLEASESFPALAEYRARHWEYGSQPDQADRFSAFVSEPARAECSRSEFSGCPKCGSSKWWQAGSCSLCNASNAEADAPRFDWLEIQQVLLQLMRLKGESLSRVTEALRTGRREVAAEILVENGSSPEDAKEAVSAWDRPRQAAEAFLQKI